MSETEQNDTTAESSGTDTTRREVLSAVGGVSMTAPLAAGVDVNWGSDTPASDRVEYVERLEHTNPTAVRREGAAPERTAVTDTVSRDHWLAVETAYDARDRILKRIQRRVGDPQVFVGVTTVTDGGQSRKAITVDRVVVEGRDSTSRPSVGLDEIKDVVPDTASGSADGTTFDGIPVVPRNQRVQETVDCDSFAYTGAFSDIPGGAKFELGSCSSNCSFATPANDDETSETKMLTAGHCFNDANIVYQPACFTEGDGEVDQIYREDDGLDFGSVKAPDGQEGYKLYTQRLADKNSEYYTDRYISGIITNDSLRMNEGDSSYEIVNHGSRTGRTTGYIKNVKTNSLGHEVVWTTATTGGGDSGCPLYKEYYNGTTYQVYIAGISAWGRGGSPGDDKCPFNQSGGNTMEYVENKLGVTV